MKKIIFCLYLIFTLSVPLLAEEPDTEKPQESSKEVRVDESELIVDEDTAFESSQWFAFHYRLGNYVPSKTLGVNGNFQAFYTGQTALWHELVAEFQPVSRYGILGARGIVGYQRITSSGANTARFENVSLHGGAIYHFKYTRHQVFVPFIEGGGSYYWLKQERQNPYNRTRRGFFGSAGIQLNLNAFEKKTADRFDLNYGINNTYITVEYKYINTPTAGVLDLSGQFFLAGFSMDF
ncbi:MAG: hypothetical protein HYW47_07455 [Deltaproteobacteria bacterium]|nr:hypothetical protein [Deltaproteobacteria bacterium]